jgi:hypothetical protein
MFQTKSVEYVVWATRRHTQDYLTNSDIRQASFLIRDESTLPLPCSNILQSQKMGWQDSNPMFCSVKRQASGRILNRSRWEHSRDEGYPFLTSCKVNHTTSITSIIKVQLQLIYNWVHHDIRMINTTLHITVTRNWVRIPVWEQELHIPWLVTLQISGGLYWRSKL